YGHGHGHGRYYGHRPHYGHRPYPYYPRYRHDHRPRASFGFHVYQFQAVQPRPVIVHEYRSEQVIYNQPAPAPQAYQPQPVPSGPASTCLMTREYQTEVAVGGRMVPGYGQACLQPDGSWYRGPAVPISY
ncbi:MAG: hypothetical protein OEM59_17100, partial [Rhodospirillales bacterium]|nr:hypothetical protein [Rhodospirillales bacterium]